MRPRAPRRHPTHIGRYVLRRLIGRGGMGRVYHAFDPVLERDVALKVLHARLAARPAFRERFVREAQSAGRLRHPNIVTIYELGEADGIPYIAMEYLEGRDLRQVIQDRLPLSLREKLDILIQACEGLGYAHAQGIVHRDIKPSNLRVLDDGRVKILDFGIAQVARQHPYTQTGLLIGTPRYIAPERVRGNRGRLDGRADIFSLGVVMYELLFYRHPFEGEDFSTIMYKILNEPPAPVEVGPGTGVLADLEPIWQKAMAKDPADRYASAYDMARDLRAVLGRLGGETVVVEPRVPIWDEPTLGLYGALPASGAASVVSGTPSPSPVSSAVVSAAVRRRVRFWPQVIGGLLVLVALLAAVSLSRRWLGTPSETSVGRMSESIRPSGPTSQERTPTSAPNPSEGTVGAADMGPPGVLILDLLPWAEVRSVRRVSDGYVVRLPASPYTPLRLSDIPPGRYEVRYWHPLMSADAVLWVDVVPGRLNEVVRSIGVSLPSVSWGEQ